MVSRVKTHRFNPETRELFNRCRKKQQREGIKILIKHIKSTNKCLDCTNTSNLTFDHVIDPKMFNIRDAPTKTLTQVNRELIKCEIVCRSCHDIREFRRGKGYDKVGLEAYHGKQSQSRTPFNS